MRIALVILGLLLVAGCGTKTEPNPDHPGVIDPGRATGTPGSEFLTPVPKEAADALPACSDVWVVGKALAQDYTGCRIAGGGIDRGANYACTDGKGDLIGHNDQFFARLGGQIRAYGEDDQAFSRELYEVCKPKQ